MIIYTVYQLDFNWIQGDTTTIPHEEKQLFLGLLWSADDTGIQVSRSARKPPARAMGFPGLGWSARKDKRKF